MVEQEKVAINALALLRIRETESLQEKVITFKRSSGEGIGYVNV